MNLEELIEEYAQHQSWRCAYQARYPWVEDCRCGLVSALRENGLPPEWAAIADPEAVIPR